MCGRYYLKISIDKLIERYGIANDDVHFLIDSIKDREKKEFDSEIFPSQKIAIIIQDKTKSRPIIKEFKWGFSPFYSKRLIINARAETIDKKKTFKKPFLEKRCLVPASAFFEWEKSNGKKIKQRIFLQNKKIFSLAGIYDSFIERGKEIQAFTIITTMANNKISRIHNRMPVILNEKDEKNWLNINFTDYTALKDLLKPYPDKDIQIIPEDQGTQMTLDF